MGHVSRCLSVQVYKYSLYHEGCSSVQVRKFSLSREVCPSDDQVRTFSLSQCVCENVCTSVCKEHACVKESEKSVCVKGTCVCVSVCVCVSDCFVSRMCS